MTLRSFCQLWQCAQVITHISRACLRKLLSIHVGGWFPWRNRFDRNCFLVYRVHFFLLNGLWNGSEIFCEIVGLLSCLQHSRCLIFRIFVRSSTKTWWYFGWLVSMQEAGSLHSSERDSKTFKDAVDEKNFLRKLWKKFSRERKKWQHQIKKGLLWPLTIQ